MLIEKSNLISENLLLIIYGTSFLLIFPSNKIYKKPPQFNNFKDITDYYHDHVSNKKVVCKLRKVLALPLYIFQKI